MERGVGQGRRHACAGNLLCPRCVPGTLQTSLLYLPPPWEVGTTISLHRLSPMKRPASGSHHKSGTHLLVHVCWTPYPCLSFPPCTTGVRSCVWGPLLPRSPLPRGHRPGDCPLFPCYSFMNSSWENGYELSARDLGQSPGFTSLVIWGCTILRCERLSMLRRGFKSLLAKSKYIFFKMP